MIPWDKVSGGFCIIVGLSLIVGFLRQFRERGYVGWLGLCFMALAGAAFISSRMHEAMRLQQKALAAAAMQQRNIVMAVAGILFVISFISAVQQTRQRIADIKRRQESIEEQMLAMLEVEREKHKKDGKSS